MHSPIDLPAADHPVKAVTIFSTTKTQHIRPANGGKAEVIRAFTVELKVRVSSGLRCSVG
jgi:hypothetical protein